MSEAELKKIEEEIKNQSDSWFFHDLAMSMVQEIKRLNQEDASHTEGR